MRNLADLSRWLLDHRDLRAEWGDEGWKQSFEACGSPEDWDDFVKANPSDPRVGVLVDQLGRIDGLNQAVPRSSIHHPVVLPNLD